eukprot:COSAG02_NODE_9021_length_2358_cov_1.832669_4_plen_77_part_00
MISFHNPGIICTGIPYTCISYSCTHEVLCLAAMRNCALPVILKSRDLTGDTFEKKFGVATVGVAVAVAPRRAHIMQ